MNISYRKHLYQFSINWYFLRRDLQPGSKKIDNCPTDSLNEYFLSMLILVMEKSISMVASVPFNWGRQNEMMREEFSFLVIRASLANRGETTDGMRWWMDDTRANMHLQ